MYISCCSGGLGITAALDLAQKIVTPVEDIHQESVAAEMAIDGGAVGPVMSTVTAADIPPVIEGVIILDHLITKNLTLTKSEEADHHILAEVQRRTIAMPAGTRV